MCFIAPMIPLILVSLSMILCSIHNMHWDPNGNCDGHISVYIKSRACGCGQNSDKMIHSILTFCHKCGKGHQEVATICNKCNSQEPNRRWHKPTCNRYSEIRTSTITTAGGAMCNRCKSPRTREYLHIQCCGCSKTHPLYFTNRDLMCPCARES
ncbi:hypothetical protein PGT21_019657 [Puccinia graminis f. sp. tritici]|uniref:Uncharacterized protein n=1 Tax=Puccinia graminis f. sp. tritici TaxID=56615 RepID=A0A5B0RIL8_PUCGR|nr:hypothetical protein PGT21_018389 [Puccinia graminis f. sp. tritici]KAA1110378.1 hypothetical protein PGT21_019657 [Puccinia graminis f. sp. tritici]KAA1125507.1 hypothetical protein PGTUg99_010753 [Puccinia graminis f. sp. tritici]KAA1134905.1 hypothetical protein PGTUg99_016077 [Puccinia graminis f. sp. tritici]